MLGHRLRLRRGIGHVHRLGDGLDVAISPERGDLLGSDERGVLRRVAVGAIAARWRLGKGVERQQVLVHGALEPPREEVQLLGGQRVRGSRGDLGDDSQERLLIEAFVDDGSFETVLEEFRQCVEARSQGGGSIEPSLAQDLHVGCSHGHALRPIVVGADPGLWHHGATTL